MPTCGMVHAQPRGFEAVRPRAVILTALPDEYEAVRNHLTNLREHTHDQGTVYQIGDFLARSDCKWEVCLAEIGAGNPSAAQETERAVAFFKPNVAMFVGVAGGLKDVSIGDVVVATKVYAYESGKAEGKFRTRPEVYPCAYDLEQRARAEARSDDWVKRIEGFDGLAPRVYVAPVASGEKVVASRRSAFYRFVRESYGDALAVEMEGSGFLEAVRAHPNVRALIVRGISDLIDGKLQTDRAGSQPQAARHASAFAFAVLRKYSPSSEGPAAITNPFIFEENADIECLLKNVALGDWDSSGDIAIQLIKHTDADGNNPIFDALLKYYDCPDEDLRWAAFQVVESAATLSPNLIDRKTLAYFAEHPDFSVRASAASICMELARFAATRVPVDILIRLSVHNEDWYVQAPANAAVKTLVRSMPQILRIFISRLHSPNPVEREHAAAALADIATTEPELLDFEKMRDEAMLLQS